MSCIAVNLHEVKKDEIRFQLAEKLYGKNGAKQEGKWYDLISKKITTEFSLPSPGIYAVNIITTGKEISSVDFVPSNIPLIEGKDILISNTRDVYWFKTERFVFHAETRTIQPLAGLLPETVIDTYYVSMVRIG